MAGDSSGWIAPPDAAVYCVISLLYAGLAATGVAVGRALRKAPGWSLADALSEEADLTDGGVSRTVLAASASRTIAFMGMLGILMLFLGFGAFALWGVAETGQMPRESGDFGKYLLGGMTLFAPYVVNKFSSVFSGS